MKMKKFCLLFLLALVLTSCSFDSSENGLANWAESKGIPSGYPVQVVVVENITPSSMVAGLDSTPHSADLWGLLGKNANLSHDLYFDFAFVVDSGFIASLSQGDSAGTYLGMSWLNALYTSKYYPADSLPMSEELDVTVSWILDFSDKKKLLDSLAQISDSSWYASLGDWDDAASADTVFSMDYAKGDTSIRLQLPSALLEELKEMDKAAAHLQLKVSAPNASRLYKFYGDTTALSPILVAYSDTDFVSVTPFRMANVTKNLEDCVECPVLHGGVYDSIVVELPSEPIMKALSDFYGEEFPVSEDEKFDVRQNVVMAQLIMSRDDSSGESELGLPIQVVVGSFIDSADTQIRRMETYRLNDAEILDIGHQNLIFHDGDSLKLQLTNGVRDLINRGSDGRDLKFMMRMGYPFLQEKDTTYATYVTDQGDTVLRSLSVFDYARYDFSSVMNKPMTLKIWLASKREGK